MRLLYSGATTLLSDKEPQKEREQETIYSTGVTIDVEMSFTGSSELIE
jgi:hypothetical protein